jgi:hypothetical protein
VTVPSPPTRTGGHALLNPAADDPDAGVLGLLDDGVRLPADELPLVVGDLHRAAGK